MNAREEYLRRAVLAEETIAATRDPLVKNTLREIAHGYRHLAAYAAGGQYPVIKKR